MQSIFAGGRIRSGVRFSEARQQEELLIYQQTIQQAIRGVSDVLVEYRKRQGVPRAAGATCGQNTFGRDEVNR